MGIAGYRNGQDLSESEQRGLIVEYLFIIFVRQCQRPPLYCHNLSASQTVHFDFSSHCRINELELKRQRRITAPGVTELREHNDGLITLEMRRRRYSAGIYTSTITALIGAYEAEDGSSAQA